MSNSYHYKKGQMQLGPYPLERMQGLARQGQVGRTHQISTDGGETWAAGSTFPEIFQAPPPAEKRRRGTADSRSPLEDDWTEPTSAGASGEWLVAQNGQQLGPFSFTQLQQAVADQRIYPYDLFWKPGMQEWVHGDTVSGLFAAAKPEASPAVKALFPSRAGGSAGAGGGAFCRECGASINRRAVICTQCGVPTDPESDSIDQLSGRGSSVSLSATSGRRSSGPLKSKSTAVLLALCLGGLGAHHFYLGNIGLGVLYLLFCFTFIPAIISFIEGIVFVCMTEEAFDAKYNS